MSPIRPQELYSLDAYPTPRQFIAKAMEELKPEIAYFTAAGKFNGVGAAVQGGVEPNRIWASDLSLYSAIVGYWLDPDKTPDDLEITPSDNVTMFLDGCTTDLEKTSALLLALKWCQIEPKNAYLTSVRRELRANQERHMDRFGRSLLKLRETLGGIHYDHENLWDVLERAEQEQPEGAYWNGDTVWKVNDFARQFEVAEQEFGFAGLQGREFNPEDIGELMNRVAAIPGMMSTFHVGSHMQHMIPPGWTEVCAYAGDETHHGRGYDKLNRIYTNLENMESRYVASQVTRLEKFSYPVYTDQEITKDSKLKIAPVSRDAALYYCDLFIHQKTLGHAERYFLATIDGRVFSSIGIMLNDALVGNSRNVEEWFGVTKLSRYKRLQKLTTLALTSDSFRRLLYAMVPPLQTKELEALKTVEIRPYQHVKGAKGHDKPIKVETYKEGASYTRYKFTYQRPFRDDTWDDCVKFWLEKWGTVQR